MLHNSSEQSAAEQKYFTTKRHNNNGIARQFQSYQTVNGEAGYNCKVYRWPG